jgi:hypothetical protein
LVTGQRAAALICLIFLAGIDGFLAFLDVLFSEMIFGSHEGLHGESTAVAIWAISLIVCIAAPIAGFVLWAYRRSGIGISVAALPIAVEVLVLAAA